MIPGYDKSKCQGRWLKGYSGCMCEYCHSYNALRGKWKVHVHGDKEDYEISVLRENNRHGQVSWGWDSADKIILSAGDDERAFSLLKQTAHALADKLNEKEYNNNNEMPKLRRSTKRSRSK